MNRDDFFRLAVLLVAPTMQQGALGKAGGIKAAATEVNKAYNALLLAYRHIPENGDDASFPA
jgi:hypothetical protein